MRKIVFLLIFILCMSGMIGCGSRIEVYDDISGYGDRMSFGARNADDKWYKWGMDESVWPENIDDDARVSDYKMVYYNPWDAQYLGYLAIEYPDADYKAEVERLRAYPSTEYVGYYSVQAEETYELLAINADAYHGFVYALTDGKHRIIYAEQIFCNYFMDIDYEKYVPKEYLLDGFNARMDNPYRKEMMSNQK